MHRQRLGEEVGHVEEARDVPNDELLLGHAVLKPMQSHVARLGELNINMKQSCFFPSQLW
jgi:hypothetical protein